MRAGAEAKAALVAGNLRMVVALAKRYRWSGVPLADLFQEGVLGLLRAAERFDWRLGTPFSAYAAWWVRHAIARAVRDARVGVHLPDRQWKALRRLRRARLADPRAGIEELARAAGVDPEEAERLLPLLGTPASLTFGVAGVLGPFAGALGDRFDRRRVMIWSEAVAASFFVLMALVDGPAVLIALAFGSAIAELPFFSASRAAIPNLVEGGGGRRLGQRSRHGRGPGRDRARPADRGAARVHHLGVSDRVRASGGDRIERGFRFVVR